MLKIFSEELFFKTEASFHPRLSTSCMPPFPPLAPKGLTTCALSPTKIILSNTILSKEAHLNLTKIKGIGDWTADIYQLFVLGDMDAFPQDDLAVQEGAKRFFRLNHRPKGKELLKLAEKWKPLRGAAALVMWQIYRIEIHEGSKFN